MDKVFAKLRHPKESKQKRAFGNAEMVFRLTPARSCCISFLTRNPYIFGNSTWGMDVRC